MKAGHMGGTEPKQAGDFQRLIAHAVESIAEAVSITDLDDRFTFVNRAFLGIYGYTCEEVLGRHVSLVWSPDNPSGLQAEILDRTRAGGWKGELLSRTKDGRELPIALSTSYIRDDGGMIRGLVGIAEDITARKQAEETVLARALQLEAVRTVTAEITRELDLTTLLGLIIQRSKELVGADAGSIYLWDEAGEVLIPQAWHGLGEWMREVRLKPGEAVAGTVAQRREGMIVNDFPASPYAFPLFHERARTTAVLAEPLLYRDRLVGVITLTHNQAGRQFTEEHQSLLRLLAAQAAIAIENARLHEATVRRGEELEALLGATRTVMSGLDLKGTLDRIIQEAAQISGIPHVKVVLVDKEAQVLRIGAAMGRPAEMLTEFGHPMGSGFSGIVATTGQPLFAPNCQDDPRNFGAEQDQALGIQTYLGLPIKSRDEILGVLTFNTEQPHEYSAEELTYLASFADQAAIAIENARLHEQLSRRLERLQALTRITQLLSSFLDLDTVLHEITKTAGVFMGAKCVTFWVADEAQRTVELRAASDEGAIDHPKRLLRYGEGSVGWVAEHRTVLNAPDRFADERFYGQDWARRHGFVSFLGIPVLMGDSLLAILALNGERPFTLDRDDESLFDSFVAHAAIAIENARLYDAVQRHAGELEERVRQRTAELEEALRVKAEFLATMSHELRTPLNPIIGFSELLQQQTSGPLTPKQARYVNRIHEGGKRLLELVTAILEVVQGETGTSRLHLESVALGPLIQEVLDVVREQVTQKQLTVTTSLESAPPVVVADRHKLTQILSYLVGNAVKFTPEGGTITVRAQRVPCIAECGLRNAELPATDMAPQSAIRNLQSEMLEIAVEDTGIGIRSEDRESIFEAFHQVDGSESRAYGGAGLGLTLVRRLVELHGGLAWAESAGLGRGSRFVVRLPRLELPQ